MSMDTLTAPHKLVKKSASYGPHYQLVIKPNIVADVYRTGSLPSCYRWQAVIRLPALDEYEARTGRTWALINSSSARGEVVERFLRQYAPASLEVDRA